MSSARRTGSRRSRRGRGLGCSVTAGITAVVLVTAVISGLVWLRMNEYIAPTPFESRCRFTAAGSTTVLDLQQAHYAGIIVGRAVARGLPARAGSIAMATAYQESGIRNLDYGDRDSVGLFQQRPSQGWGTRAQILDPYYSTDAFYNSLVKIDGWETGDINTVAQTVQRSGHPQAYRQHEPDARVLASVLAGHSPAGVTCGYSTKSAADARGLASSLRQALGVSATVSPDGMTLTVNGRSDQEAWAIAHHAVVNASATGVATVRVADQQWKWASRTVPEWSRTGSGAGGRTVTVTFLTS